jgi:hypothetical protein
MPGVYKIIELRWITDNAGNQAEMDVSNLNLSFTVKNP